ncbi:protein phosphatase 2C domain-containing protein [Streptomyces sp. NPDC006482]|uniref:PP2C family protein-serine/threonine phosphatase n=1 Tax=Streptomyces sp. NPDC006482 TaxID=3154306 RepID=UPI0033A1FBCF
MRPYATAQQIGTRDVQCDAAAIRTAPSRNARAYVVLDGIGDTPSVRAWVKTTAAQLAYAAARRADPEAGLRTLHHRIAAQRAARNPDVYSAAAIVAVTAPSRPLAIAWAGDCRAYLITPDGQAQQLTQDHNLRRVNGGNRNKITCYLGSTRTDQELMDWFNHPAVESLTLPDAHGRLLLASDGAYEPHEDARGALAAELGGDLTQAVRRFTTTAVERSAAVTRALDPNRVHADNATALLADLP